MLSIKRISKLPHAILFLLVLAGYTHARASVILVENTSNAGIGSLRAAIASASDFDTILINTKGTITLNSQIDIIGMNDLTIIGPYPKHNTISPSSGWSGSLFNINGSARILIQGLSFRDSYGTTRFVKIKDCADIISFKACLFENGNLPGADGGAVLIEDSNTEFNQCSFIANTASNGGAICLVDNSTSKLINSTFSENYATDKAGALQIGGTSKVYSYHCTYVYNNSGGNPTTIRATGGTEFYAENNAIGANGTTRQIILLGTVTNYGGNRMKLNYVSEPNDFGLPILGDVFDLSLELGIRATLLEDGYGLKYWPIVSSSSGLINVQSSSIRTPDVDCRNAPRALKGTSAVLAYPDAGAAEYTHLRVTNSSGNKATTNSFLWTLETAQRKDDVHFIEFDIPSPLAINPTSEGIAGGDAYIIDGFTQPGSTIPGPNQIGFSGLTPAVLPIQLVNAGGIEDGIQFNFGSAGSRVVGLSIQNFDKHGINVTTSGFTLYGCEIGLTAAGIANGCRASGIIIKNSNATIGGWEHWQRNVISGNGQTADPENSNIYLNAGTNIKILGNIIGIDPTGMTSLGTADHTKFGILAYPGYCRIGASLVNSGNIIGDNEYGIILDLASDYDTIQSNKIGMSWDGLTPQGNTICGVLLYGADETIIGGYSPDKGNIIAYNGVGVGLLYNTTPASNNSILGNSIYQNDEQGIDLGYNNIIVPNDGLTNSSQDNNGLDFPTLTAASNCDLAETIISYELSVPTGIAYRVEFFTNSSPDPFNGEGETFLGYQTVSVSTNPQSFNYNVGSLLPFGTSLTATVTSLSSHSTSEFGINVLVNGGNEATISYLDICYGDVATPTIAGDLGGVFSYDGGDPLDGSILDALTGALSNGIEGTTYSIVYGFADGCGLEDTTTVTILNVDESFVMDDFCPGADGTAIPTIPGGVFSFNPLPGDGATITSDSGILSGGIEGTTYTIQYIATSGTCADTALVDVSVIATDATFSMADICPEITSASATPITPGGTFSFNPDPLDFSAINASTGAISGGIEGSSYTIRYTVGACAKTFDLTINVIETDESFTYADFCPGELGSPFGIAETGGTFSLEIDDDPAFINSATGVITDAIEGTTYYVIYEVGVCAARDTVSTTVLTVPQEFTFANFCVVSDSSGTGPIAADPGIANYILLGPADGATINPTTGIIHYPIEGTIYTVVDSASTGVCWQADTILVQAVEVNENFVMDNICFGETATPIVEAVLIDTFFFVIDPAPLDPVLINAYSGDVTFGSANTSYTVRRIAYEGTCADSAETTFTVDQPNANFVFDDFCPTDLSPEPIEEVEGGTYTLEFIGGFGETIDPISGAISGPQEDSSYAVIYTLLLDGCENSDTQTVSVINVPEGFTYENFCWQADSDPGIPDMAGGEWSFGMPYPGDGAEINGVDGVITGATEGTTYAVEYTLTVGSCSEEDSLVVTAIGVDETFVFPSICPIVSSAPPTPATDGGEYSFIPLDPGDGAIINSTTGVITNGVEGASYDVHYVVFDLTATCSESSTNSVAVISIDESFSTSNFCADFESNPIIPATPGGIFSFAPDLVDGSIINPSNGVINNAVSGTTYAIEYSITEDICTETDTNFIYARESDDPSFTLPNHCINSNIEADITGTPGGVFDFETPPGDGAIIDSSTGLISNSTGNTYDVRYITVGGTEICVDTLVLTIELYPQPAIITIESDILVYCPEVTLGPIEVTEQTDAFKIYWYEDAAVSIVLDSTFSFIPTELNVGSNTFYTQAKSTEGCLSEIESFTVSLSDTSGMRAASDLTICLGSPAQLEAYGGNAYLWTTAVPLGDYTTQNPVAFSLKEEDYIVRISNVDNCDVYDTLSVRFTPQNECDINMFNAFSPNDDGKNDIWYIENLINHLPNTVYIYNRWGDELLAIENYDNINAYWDGTGSNGAPLMPGTYFYVVITEYPEYNQAGWVQLVR